jgi:DNA-binding XRE family transcriptional regulator
MQQSNRPAIKLRTDRLRVHARKLGITSETDIAAHLGVARSTVVRVQNGEVAPGENFIAAALLAFPDLKFEDLFKVTGRVNGNGAVASGTRHAS